jgi:hypothetical protein
MKRQICGPSAPSTFIPPKGRACRNQTGILPPIQVAAHQSHQLREGGMLGKAFWTKGSNLSHISSSILPSPSFGFETSSSLSENARQPVELGHDPARPRTHHFTSAPAFVH